MNEFNWEDQSREMKRNSSQETLSEEERVLKLTPKYLHLDPPIAATMKIISKTVPKPYYTEPQEALVIDDATTLQRNKSPRYNRAFKHPIAPSEMESNTNYIVENNRVENLQDYKEQISSHNDINSFIEARELEKKRFVYGCIPSNIKSRNICLSVTLLVLLIIGILLFLFFPRMPTFKVLGFIDDTKGGIKYNLESFDRTKPETLHFTMQMVMNITVLNSNYYSLTVNRIKLKTFIIANMTEINESLPHPAQGLFGSSVSKWRPITENTQKNYIGSGYALAQTFRPSVNISFPMPLEVDYRPRTDLGGATNDPTLNELIQLCVGGDQSRRSVIYYEAENEISALSFLGIKPVTSGYGQIACPFQGPSREKFFLYLQGK